MTENNVAESQDAAFDSDTSKEIEIAPDTSEQKDNVNAQENLAHIVYLLQAIGFFVGITYIAGVILNHIKNRDITDDVVKSHFRWQIRTFWFSLLWSVIGIVLSLVLIGYILLLVNFVWVLYRVIRGWLRLRDSQPMYA